jgi:hypothetical protein
LAYLIPFGAAGVAIALGTATWRRAPQRPESVDSPYSRESLALSSRILRRAGVLLLCFSLFFGAFLCQASSPDYHQLFRGVAPVLYGLILIGTAVSGRSFRPQRTVVLLFTLLATLAVL